MSDRRRGIYLLPNLFTTGALFAGFYSMTAAVGGHYQVAAIAVFVALALDVLDGRVARLTNTQSAFGSQYDSCSDMVSFGVAPAILLYQWSLSGVGKLGWAVSFVYAAAAALRLARYNTQAAGHDKRFFQGLPSPAAAVLVAGHVWLCESGAALTGAANVAVSMAVAVAAALLMVSNIRYHSFKNIDFLGRVRFLVVLAIVAVFVLVSIRPPLVLALFAFGYAVSGPANNLLHLYRRHRGGLLPGLKKRLTRLYRRLRKRE
ncbi:MAG: CDP-diacylglycerol--serine O-phosphatidyltransferase [Gammaproteobacteria bacterium]|nr:CDP-diacylglycerol--serine O-phosphatidyltransferase [Gammaproteobacteria bacterium]